MSPNINMRVKNGFNLTPTINDLAPHKHE